MEAAIAPRSILVSGGAGYIGAPLCLGLVQEGHTVRVLDSLLHHQDDVAAQLEAGGVELVRADVRDPEARRQAVDGMDALVHLAAIVGDPACARDPDQAHLVNVEATRALISAAAEAGTRRVVFASTCSNYGRIADPTTPIDETGTLAPVSLYAEQKVEVERWLLSNAAPETIRPTCLRFATVYGYAPRMRFDLTVNEFTRDLQRGRRLEVFGEQFWRPYVHVRDAGRAIAAVLHAPEAVVAGEVFNVGRSGENYRKLDLVQEIRRLIPDGEVEYVRRDEDPRDYKVNFDKIRSVLGFETEMIVPDGIREVIGVLQDGTINDPYEPRYLNIP